MGYSKFNGHGWQPTIRGMRITVEQILLHWRAALQLEKTRSSSILLYLKNPIDLTLQGKKIILCMTLITEVEYGKTGIQTKKLEPIL